MPWFADLFEESITDARLVDAYAGLRVPRHLFKFLYRTLAAHCQQAQLLVAAVGVERRPLFVGSLAWRRSA